MSKWLTPALIWLTLLGVWWTAYSCGYAKGRHQGQRDVLTAFEGVIVQDQTEPPTATQGDSHCEP